MGGVADGYWHTAGYGMNRILGLALLLLLQIACPHLAWPAGSGTAETLTLVVENDLFSNRDGHYTSGVRFSWVPGRNTSAPEWAVKTARVAPWFPERGEIRHGYAIGQSMFTPRDITTPNPPLSDRPYAGWLYATIGLGAESGRQLDQFAITIGMIGPASLAEQSQKLVHQITSSREPQGWDTQLRNEPGIIVSYQRSWRRRVATNVFGNRLDFTPHLGAALGNVYTHANAGLTVRFGQQLPIDYGPPRILPGMPGPGDFSPASDFGWYLFAGVEGRAVARNIFLDGNTFRDSRSVEKEPLVGDLQFGIVLDWSDVRVSYTHVLRTREFTTQVGNDDFGAIGVSVKL